MSLLDLDDCECCSGFKEKPKVRTDRLDPASPCLFLTVEPAPSPQVTPVNSFLSNSLVTDLEGLSLSDAVLSPAVNASPFLSRVFPLLAFTEKTRSKVPQYKHSGIAVTMCCPLFRPQTISPSSALKNYELLHRITGEGLSVEYCFSRQPFSPDANMVAVQMQFTNSGPAHAQSLHMEEAKLQSGMRVREFPEIGEGQLFSTGSGVLSLSQADHSCWDGTGDWSAVDRGGQVSSQLKELLLEKVSL